MDGGPHGVGIDSARAQQIDNSAVSKPIVVKMGRPVRRPESRFTMAGLAPRVFPFIGKGPPKGRRRIRQQHRVATGIAIPGMPKKSAIIDHRQWPGDAKQIRRWARPLYQISRVIGAVHVLAVNA